MLATQHLNEAARLVSGERRRQHGDVRALHEQVARLWTAYLEPSRNPLASSLTAIDVLAMMALLKLARAQHGIFNRDDYVDALGYIALAGQVAEENHEQLAQVQR